MIDLFNKNGGKLKFSLKDDIDKLNIVFEEKHPQNRKVTAVKYNKIGRHLLCIEYATDVPSTAKFLIAAKVNDEVNLSESVSGTEGNKSQIYIDFTTYDTEGNIEMIYPELISINKITIMC